MDEQLHTPDEVKAQCEAFRDSFSRLKTQVGRVIVGHEEVVEGVLICLFAGGNVLLEGVPGLGKTLLVRTLAQALHLPFSRIQFTPDLMPADITGSQNPPTTIRSQGTSLSCEFRARAGVRPDRAGRRDQPQPRRRRSRPCSRRCRRSQVTDRRRVVTPWASDFFVIATQNPVEFRRAPTRCPRPSSIDSCSRSTSATASSTTS